MTPRVLSKILAVVVLGVAANFASHHYEANRHQMGKAAFLAAQAQRFDEFYANPRAPLSPGAVYASVSMVFLSVGIYELLAAGFYILLKCRSNAGAT